MVKMTKTTREIYELMDKSYSEYLQNKVSNKRLKEIHKEVWYSSDEVDKIRDYNKELLVNLDKLRKKDIQEAIKQERERISNIINQTIIKFEDTLNNYEYRAMVSTKKIDEGILKRLNKIKNELNSQSSSGNLEDVKLTSCQREKSAEQDTLKRTK